MIITLNVNRQPKTFEIHSGETLLNVLRRNHFTEVKRGCNEGHCGSCVVLLDGDAVNACQVLAGSADKRDVTTVRGIGTQQKPHIIQQALAEVGGVQCGFCTPGVVVAAYALLSKNSNPTEADIRTALDGNLCRCTGYLKIIEGIQLAATRIRNG